MKKSDQELTMEDLKKREEVYQKVWGLLSGIGDEEDADKYWRKARSLEEERANRFEKKHKTTWEATRKGFLSDIQQRGTSSNQGEEKKESSSQQRRP